MWKSIVPLAVLVLAACGGGTSGGSDLAFDTALGPDLSPARDTAPPVDTRRQPDTSPEETAPPAEVMPIPPDDWVTTEEMAPSNVHLTWQNDPSTTMTVQWNISPAVVEGYVPRVWFAGKDEIQDGVYPMGPGRVVEGACEEYWEELLGVHVSGPYYICEVEVTGLEPSSVYVYRAGTWGDFDYTQRSFVEPDLSQAFTFRTGLPKGSQEPFVFISAGDSRGGYENIAQHTPALTKYDASFWLFNGDMCDSGAQEEWELWFESMASVSRDMVIMPVRGNHEMFIEVFYAMFAMPRPEMLPDDKKEYGWSFDYGNAHFIGMETASEIAIETQLPWLEADLSAARSDPDIKWIVVLFHYAAYSSSTAHGSTVRVQQLIVPLLEKYDVDLVFSGHDHIYERTHPIFENQVDQEKGITYVVAGGYFAPGYSAGNDWFTAVSHHGDIANYVIMEVTPDHLKGTAYSGDSTQVLDEFTLTK